jgi:hypothetical protein
MGEKIVISPELRDLSIPLQPSEQAILEANLQRDGCRDALVVYRDDENESILLDGHRRLEICERNGLLYSIREIAIGSHEEAIQWVCEHHLARRNLNESQRAIFGAQLATLRQGARTDLAPNGGRSQTAAAKASWNRPGINRSHHHEATAAHAGIARGGVSRARRRKAGAPGPRRSEERNSEGGECD